jgi:hypothetical protein
MSGFELSKARCLISGTSSGIGKFLSTKLPFAERYDRSTPISNYKNQTYDAIIHCAYGDGFLKGHKNIYEQSKSNIRLVEDLCDINCGVFIFFSSIDVYPRGFSGSLSDFELGSGEMLSRHAFFKIIGESIIGSKVKQHLILRPSLMVGKDARASTFVNIIRGSKGPFTLAKKSRFNLITHDQVLFCLQAALATKTKGTINLCSGLELSLDEVARHVSNDNISWGRFEYQTPKIEGSNTVKFFGGVENNISDLISTVLSW